MTESARIFLIVVAIIGGLFPLVPLVVDLVGSARKPREVRNLAEAMRAAAAVEAAEYRRQRARSEKEHPDELARERKTAAEEAFKRIAGKDTIMPKGPESTMLVLAAAIDQSRAARRNILWVTGGVVITAIGTILALQAEVVLPG